MSSETCPTAATLVDERLSRVLTQYRESPKLLHVLTTYLTSVASAHLKICDMPSRFSINTATGDQLTLIGKRLGWPRQHCVCDVQPVFGFDCEGVLTETPVAGFCDESISWLNCGVAGTGEITIGDDELYRKLLKVRVYQSEAMFDTQSLEECLRILWGDTAVLMSAGFGRVVVAPGRELSDAEISILQLYPRVLPVALGVEVRFHFGETLVFGFGEGWGEFCEPTVDAEQLSDGADSFLVDETGDTDDSAIITGPLTQGATWLCEFDVTPYAC